MMKLKNKKVAILAENGFEESELFEPLDRLKKEGANVQILSSKSGEIQAMKDKEWSKKIEVDHTFDEVSASDFDAILIPGGVINPDKLREEESALKLIRKFHEKNMPIASICHGPQVLINAEVVEGKKLTSYSSIRKDLENAGAQWVDEEVVVDNGMVTSRNPDDLPAFMDKMVEEFAEGKH